MPTVKLFVRVFRKPNSRGNLACGNRDRMNVHGTSDLGDLPYPDNTGI
jgi:hypothetical protein